MAAALHLPATSETQLSSLGLQDTYSRRMTITDLDLRDDRYPTFSSSSRHTPALSSSPLVYSDGPPADAPTTTDGARTSWVDYTPVMGRQSGYNEAWVGEMPEKQRQSPSQQPQHQPIDSSPQGRDVIGQRESQSLVADGIGSVLTPSGSNPSPAGLDGRGGLPRDDNDPDSSPPFLSTPQFPGEGLPSPEMGQRASGLLQVRGNQYVASSPRHPSLPPAGAGTAQSTSVVPPSPIVPMSAGPSYSPAAAAAAMAIPISPKPRAFAQQPTYINSSTANPSYAPPQIPKEEVCVECAMRDQDMADVDVTSPGIWERESDALYEELCRREELEAVAGLPPPPENSGRPRAKGHRLTEEHLKAWTAVNPKEPSSRQQTLDQYVKSQRALLEAEAAAHSRAMRESRMIDDRMRDAYAQLRRSAYELGSSAQPVDDTTGVRIKSPRSMSASQVPVASHSREVTLLENGMIVEHVDVKKEEKERKREERRERSRARKSSRGSRGNNVDVTSVYSLNTPMQTDSGFFSGMRSESRYSQSISQRPPSIMTGATGGNEIPPLLRAQSQASFSDMQSIGSSATSPRRSRFFGFKNLSTGFRSQDSLAPSGSMIDMHLALHQEQQYRHLANRGGDTVDIGSNAPTLRAGEGFAGPVAQEQPDATEVQATKKRKGLLKFWKLVTGQLDKRETPETRRSQSRSMDRTLDEPLAPPPPLSYLLNRGSKGHLSTPSLPSAISPSSLSPYATSPPTAPSSLVPSPTSSPRSTGDNSDRKREPSGQEYDDQGGIVEPTVSDYDLRGRPRQPSWATPNSFNPSSPPTSIPAFPTARPRNAAARRDKSLPPLPGESPIEFPNQQRPQTVFTYDPRTMPFDGLLPPDAAFRSAETRRQSFGGLTSRPFGGSQTLPAKGAIARSPNVPSFLAEEKYGEFGMPGQTSRNSLYVPPDKPKKRKSKFGLTSLFGRKSTEQVDPPSVDPLDFGFRNSQDARYMSMYVNENGYASPMSASSHNPASRMSMFSRKNIEELVDQDPEFIAYRYPSSDQRLDLMR